MVIVGASCANAPGVDRARNAAIALMAGRERAIFFVIVRKERTMRRKCCPKCGASTTSRARRPARRGSGTEIMFGKHEAIGAGRSEEHTSELQVLMRIS